MREELEVKVVLIYFKLETDRNDEIILFKP